MNPIDRVIAISQFLILGLWAGLGYLFFDWQPLEVAIFGFVGLWTFNILTATGVRTFFKLMTPKPVRSGAEVNVDPIEITPEDIGG